MRRLLVLTVATTMFLGLALPAEAAGKGIDFVGFTGYGCVSGAEHLDFRATDTSGRLRYLYLEMYYLEGVNPVPLATGMTPTGRGELTLSFSNVPVTPGETYYLEAQLYVPTKNKGDKKIDHVILTHVACSS